MKLNSSLTLKSMSVVALTATLTWLISDHFESQAVNETFTKKLKAQLSEKAREHRTRFDQYIKSHNDAVALLASNSAATRHITRLPDNCSARQHKESPPWLPKPGLMRRFIKPRMVFLLNNQRQVCEYFSPADPVPSQLLRPDEMLLVLSRQQSFITSFNNQPYLVTSEPVRSGSGQQRAMMLLASPVDGRFLAGSQAPSTGHDIIALLSGSSDDIIVSSHEDMLPAGTTLKLASKNYFVTGLGFFDYGASDVTIRFASLLPNAEVTELTDSIMSSAHRSRAMTALIYVVTFGLMIIWIVKRIESLTQRVVDFSVAMDVDDTEDTKHGDPIDILHDRFASLALKIARETEALEYQALHDPLTDLPNRKLLIGSIEREIFRSKRYKTPFALLMIDLDRFKDINDTLGHHMGDFILQQAAERLTELLRHSDLVARLGGDEFGILLPETAQKDAISTAEKICAAFEKPFILDEYNLTVGVSIGIAEYPDHGQDEIILLQRADVAMYMAKRRGGGHALYDPRRDEYSHDRLSLMTEMRDALQNNSLELYYQPIINTRNYELVCAEALLRWGHQRWEDVGPETFIPLAEHTGLIQPLTDWIVRRAVSQCASWQDHGLDIGISINISVHNLHDTALTDKLLQALEANNVSPGKVHIELTESAIMTDPMYAQKTLGELFERGVQISIDDFGTGYSSLSYLKQLPVSHIKVDRSFVRDMDRDDNDAMIVRATIDLAHNLGLKVIAEGVENMETLDLLGILGCDLAQGYRIGKPMPADAFIEWCDTYKQQFAGRGVI
ncbi:MAG: EAL domain-containing protein [Gammaproteobacteria bacterium]|nr:EAL domain-containing protein [Gammaproteobacteria bacterium]